MRRLKKKKLERSKLHYSFNLDLLSSSFSKELSNPTPKKVSLLPLQTMTTPTGPLSPLSFSLPLSSPRERERGKASEERTKGLPRLSFLSENPNWPALSSVSSSFHHPPPPLSGSPKTLSLSIGAEVNDSVPHSGGEREPGVAGTGFEGRRKEVHCRRIPFYPRHSLFSSFSLFPSCLFLSCCLF